MSASRAPAASSTSAGSTSAGGRLVSGPSAWGLESLRGRLVELMVEGDGATLTAAFEVILEAQESGEPAAWVSATPTIFSPVDVASSGVDLSALAVVRVRNVLTAVRGAEQLLRSGAFGVVVLDLGPNPQVPSAALGKLVKLAQLHDAAVLGLTVSRRGNASLGSLVSLRVASQRARRAEGEFVLRLEALKDKRRGPGWTVEGVYGGPLGLR